MSTPVLKFDPAIDLDIVIRIERNGSGILEFYDDAGDPVDMSTTEWELRLKKQAGAPDIITLTSTDGDITITGDDNEIVTINETETTVSIRPAVYFHEIFRVDLGQTWFVGNAHVINGRYGC